jgi:hypothetical protein
VHQSQGQGDEDSIGKFDRESIRNYCTAGSVGLLGTVFFFLPSELSGIAWSWRLAALADCTRR